MVRIASINPASAKQLGRVPNLHGSTETTIKSLTLIAILAALSLSPTSSNAQEGHEHAAAGAAVAAASAATISSKQAATRAALRDLWVEHVFWSRNYVIASAAGNQAGQKVATEQAIANARSISGAIASFYGKPAGDQMLNLLADHWGAVKDYSDATFTKNAKGQQNATGKLVANAKQIAEFLAKANPNLPEATLVALLSAHGAHHIAQIQQLASGDYAGEAKTWAAMRTHMFTIADALADGLAKQFHDKF